MNKKGFTLIELLAVLVILSIIMGIAIPNVISTLDKSEKDTYIADAKKFLSLAKTELATNINKPTEGEIVKIDLACVDNQDLTKDPDGNEYSEDESFVIVIRKDDQLVYYVNLVGKSESGKVRGIHLTEKSLLDKDGRLRYVTKGFDIPSNDDICSITGVSGTIRACNGTITTCSN